ncbi:MAG TPA: methionine--tRNA ligase [Kofleriaceae bacterium]|nr:methionine--tRNA ligase [Kofleriaceae bacterium]
MTASFITTAIPFVNARPHLGFAYELVLADILARHHRLRGRDVCFTTGTDDHSLKNAVAAAREGVPTQELVDRNAAAFRALAPLLGCAPDDFIQTSRDPRHRPAVERLWRACAGDLYKTTWQGRYCAGCEAFVDDYVTICDEHGTVPEPVHEDNWFFRLSRYREPIRAAIESGRLRIVPEAARAETLAFLAGEVRDLSVSRIAARSDGWGLPVPDDPTQIIYVWFDALVNYLSVLEGREHYWHAGERTHVIGKGITRFHAVYWPAFLLSAGLPLPDRIAVHGYLTIDGAKISKSGTSVEVGPFVDACGIDALRWYFARNCRTRGDSDVRIPAVLAAHDRDLADRLGNLVHRCTTLAHKLGDGRVPAAGDDRALAAVVAALPAQIDAALDAFLVDEAATAIVEVLDAANRALDASAPWRLAKTDRDAALRALTGPLEAARVAAIELAPFVPGVSRTILDRLGDPGGIVGEGTAPIPRRSVGA